MPILGDVKDLQWDFLGFIASNPRAGLIGVSALWTFGRRRFVSEHLPLGVLFNPRWFNQGHIAPLFSSYSCPRYLEILKNNSGWIQSRCASATSSSARPERRESRAYPFTVAWQFLFPCKGRHCSEYGCCSFKSLFWFRTFRGVMVIFTFFNFPLVWGFLETSLVLNARNRSQNTLYVVNTTQFVSDVVSGRTHRSNQVTAPEYVFLISELAGEQRFASIVAKRLESLVSFWVV